MAWVDQVCFSVYGTSLQLLESTHGSFTHDEQYLTGCREEWLDGNEAIGLEDQSGLSSVDFKIVKASISFPIDIKTGTIRTDISRNLLL